MNTSIYFLKILFNFKRVAKKEVQLVSRSSDERCSVVKIWHWQREISFYHSFSEIFWGIFGMLGNFYACGTPPQKFTNSCGKIRKNCAASESVLEKLGNFTNTIAGLHVTFLQSHTARGTPAKKNQFNWRAKLLTWFILTLDFSENS